MAEPAAAARATGYVVGGISPIGQKSRIPVIVDASANDYETVYVSAGKRGLQVELTPAHLLTAADATVADMPADFVLASKPGRLHQEPTGDPIYWGQSILRARRSAFGRILTVFAQCVSAVGLGVCVH